MRKSRGFTLVELMIVVAIMGVLAAMAVYGVARYIKHAKTAEAARSLGSIENGARQQYQRETPYGGGGSGSGPEVFVHMFCPDAPPTPASVPLAKKEKVPTTAWDHSGWTCLKFAMTDAQYYSYDHVSNKKLGTDASYTASARGDLDGNGNQSLFELTGHGGPLGDAVRDTFRVVNGDE